MKTESGRDLCTDVIFRFQEIQMMCSRSYSSPEDGRAGTVHNDLTPVLLELISPAAMNQNLPDTAKNLEFQTRCDLWNKCMEVVAAGMMSDQPQGSGKFWRSPVYQKTAMSLHTAWNTQAGKARTCQMCLRGSRPQPIPKAGSCPKG